MRMLRMLPALAPPAMLLAAGLIACSEKPDAPSYDNPFDPNGTGLDPYELTATLEGDSVRLEWKDTPEVSRWQVYHSTISSTDLNLLPTVVPTRGGGSVQATHRDYSPGRTNWYRVQAIAAGERPTSLLLGDAAMVMPPPLVRLAGGETTTSTRYVQLEVRSDVGDSLEISELDDFSESQVVDLTPGAFITVDWTLPRVESYPTDLILYFRVREGGSTGQAGEVMINADFTPALVFGEGVRLGAFGIGMVDTVVVTQAQGDGIEALRMSIDGGGTTVFSDPLAPITLRPSVASVDTFVIVAEFSSDLGPDVVVERNLVPISDVGSGTISIEGGQTTTSTREITVLLESDSAGYVRLSEDATFAGVSFQPYASSLPFLLSEGDGQKTVFVSFTTPWDLDGEQDQVQVTLESAP